MIMSFVATLLGSSGLTRDLFHPLRWWRKQRTDPQPPDPDPPDNPDDFMPKRSRGEHIPSCRLLQLALLTAIATSDTIPNTDLKHYLRSHRNAEGFLVADRLTPAYLDRLRAVLEAGECHLIKKDDHFELFFDSGCSKTVSPCKSDFIAGSLMDLVTPLAMEEIAGQFIAQQKGTI